jgi:teichuronic acid biosynthesis glycosyltransferase TuaC
MPSRQGLLQREAAELYNSLLVRLGPMRILTFTSLFPNALNASSNIFVFQRVSHLASRVGNLVEVIAPVPYAPKFLKGTARGLVASIPKFEIMRNLRVHHPRYFLLPGVSMPLHGLLMYTACLRMARSLHQKYRFDCIDAHYVFPDGLAAVLIGRSLGIPLAVTARGTDIHTFPGFKTVRPQIRWTLRHSAGVIAVSESLAKIMLEIEPTIKHLEVIGNGVDCHRFFREDQLQARKRLGLAPEARVVVSVAALKPVKGSDLLVKASSMLKTAIPRCKVIFVGAGPELRRLGLLAKRLDCHDTCEFVGPVANEELKTYYSAADVSCLASRHEGWPNVVLESLACGTPVVATRVGAVPHILNKPELGIIVDPIPEAIYGGLKRSLQRDWDSDMISAYARVYTWENVAARVENFLTRLILQSAFSRSAFRG